ncbi:glycosyltransferase family 39 protein [Moritella sp. Urea-trap-13]|uniref:ArnT family glycosyltransferase n=1 Tax=Moritella sp. Urea-trap-13 TaxID=2058327 RepID=UPI000C33FEF9|nr:glycosyltransferase family 39 protein [Moritella sp. Urea-trap-13]PKH06248.1 phospholipid carrier-dependent glycosyltransferase [Moritella sp. Urea-trap-13]
MSKAVNNVSLTKIAITLVIAAIAIRLFTLGFFPLMDTTEARYGEMARIMAETGNWITPMFDYNVPFWGKPPLFTWMSATGITLFGLNEFAVRIPHLLAGGLVLFIVALLAYSITPSHSRSERKQEAWLAAGILATTATFIVVTGAVMTDTALTLGITLSMAAFWLNYKNKSALWGHLFFIGLTIGMLAKGPLSLVLIGMSLFIWALFNKTWMSMFRSLPWKTGIPLFLATSLPWYIIAEDSSPGFLNYFIVGEHIKRFLVSGWQGDLYGTAHKEIKGTIWLFAIASALPWTPLFIYQWVKSIQTTKRTKGETRTQQDEDTVELNYTSFLWAWLLAPLLLFTFSGNILSSYVMPCLPAFALLMVVYQRNNPLSTKVYKIGLITPILILIVAILLRTEMASKQSEKGLMQTWSAQAQNKELVYIDKRPFSAQFYSRGVAVERKIKLEVAVQDITKDTYFVIRKSNETELLITSLPQCNVVDRAKKRVLVFCNANY